MWTVAYLSDSNVRSFTNHLGENFSANVTALLVKVRKPLTKDEQEKVGHLERDTDSFLKKHPDIATEALRKAKGEKLEKDHAGEAEQWARGLEQDIEHLERAREARNEEAQGQIDRAVRAGKKWIDIIKRKLSGKE